MQSASEFVEQRRPAGGRRSGKRDFIVKAFLEQQGHLAADALVDLIRSQDSRISRATTGRPEGTPVVPTRRGAVS